MSVHHFQQLFCCLGKGRGGNAALLEASIDDADDDGYAVRVKPLFDHQEPVKSTCQFV